MVASNYTQLIHKLRQVTNKNFLLLLLYVLQGNFGGALFSVALAFLTLQLTGSVSKMAITLGLNYLPRLLLPFTSTWLDRVYIKPLLLILNASRGLIITTFCLSLLIHPKCVWLIYAISFIDTAISVTYEPALDKLLTTIVKRELLNRSNGIIFFTSGVTDVFGLLLGGLLVAKLGATLVAMLYGINIFFATLPLVFLDMSRHRQDNKLLAKKQQQSFYAAIGDGLRLIFNTRILFIIALVYFVVDALVSAPFEILLPIHMNQIGKGEVGYSLFSTWNVVGTVAAGALVMCLGNKLKENKGMLFAILGFAFGLAVMALWRSFNASLCCAFILGTSSTLANLYAVTIVQKTVAFSHLGRTMGNLNCLSTLGKPVVLFLFSGVLAKISLNELVIFGAILCLVMMCLWWCTIILAKPKSDTTLVAVPAMLE